MILIRFMKEILIRLLKEKILKIRKYLFMRYILTFIILVFCSLSLSKALMIKLSLAKLSIKADAIVLGEIKEIRSQWSIDKSIIMTIVTLQIHEILKGDIDNYQLLIQFPGGEVGDIGLKVSDMPSFKQNEIVLIFLKSISDPTDTKNSPMIALNFLPSFNVFGGAQGKYSIDSNGIAHKSGYRLISKDQEREKSISLENLKAKIKIILKQNREGRERNHEKIRH